ncbi:MAG TPA: PorV/PorQ family protein [Candidatus Kapabacteria bacterium]
MLIAFSSARAQDVDESARAHLSDILTKPLSARAAAMGNAYVAMPNDPNALFSNPAAISSVEFPDSERDNLISASYSHYILDINEGAVVYEHPVPENVLFAGDFAAGVQYFSGGSLAQTSNTGEVLGSFNADQDVSLVLAYSSTASNGLHYGAAAKIVSSALVSGSSVQNYSASWIAADLGLYYEWIQERMTFGLSVTNLGGELSEYAGVNEPVGADVQLGATIRPQHLPLTISLAFHNLTGDREGRNLFYALNDFSLGGEFVMGKVVRLRFGYENELRHELNVPTGSGLAGFSGGIGLHIKRYDIDFALNDEGPDFTSFFRFGIRTEF